jgi:hypothetical protein
MLIWKKEELPHQWKESVVVPIHKNGEKNRLVIIEAHHHLFIDFKKARREALYNILIEFGIPRKLLRLIKTC